MFRKLRVFIQLLISKLGLTKLLLELNDLVSENFLKGLCYVSVLSLAQYCDLLTMALISQDIKGVDETVPGS